MKDHLIADHHVVADKNVRIDFCVVPNFYVVSDVRKRATVNIFTCCCERSRTALIASCIVLKFPVPFCATVNDEGYVCGCAKTEGCRQ